MFPSVSEWHLSIEDEGVTEQFDELEIETAWSSLWRDPAPTT